jgi:hypothetical protein
MVVFAAAGCVSPVEVAFHAPQPVLAQQTWSWAHDPGIRVSAPTDEAAALEAALRASIADQLARRGFRRTPAGGDLVVGYRLFVARNRVVEYRARAPYLLSSHSHTPSFVIEGSVPVERIRREIHLDIRASDRAGAILWRGELRQRADETFAASLREAADRLLARFPRRAAPDDAKPCGAGMDRPGDAGAPRRCRPTAPAIRPDVAVKTAAAAAGSGRRPALQCGA